MNKVLIIITTTTKEPIILKLFVKCTRTLSSKIGLRIVLVKDCRQNALP